MKCGLLAQIADEVGEIIFLKNHGMRFRPLHRFLFSLWLLISINFFLIRQLPGSPLDRMDFLNPAVDRSWAKDLGMDTSVLQQYLQYFQKIIKADLGPSISFPGSSVNDLIAQHWQVTASLNFLALGMVFILSVIFIWAQLKNPEGLLAKIFYALTLVIISGPSILLAPLLILIFSVYADWIPAAFLSSPRHYILPCLILSLRPAVFLSRTLISFMKEEILKDYVRTAKAKGLSMTMIIFKHILKNSLLPILSSLGPLCVGLVSGSAFIEILFAIPGLGGLFVDSLKQRDYFLSSGLVLVFGSTLIFLTLFFEFLSRRIDPRLNEEA